MASRVFYRFCWRLPIKQKLEFTRHHFGAGELQPRYPFHLTLKRLSSPTHPEFNAGAAAGVFFGEPRNKQPTQPLSQEENHNRALVFFCLWFSFWLPLKTNQKEVDPCARQWALFASPSWCALGSLCFKSPCRYPKFWTGTWLLLGNILHFASCGLVVEIQVYLTANI